MCEVIYVIRGTILLEKIIINRKYRMSNYISAHTNDNRLLVVILIC